MTRSFDGGRLMVGCAWLLWGTVLAQEPATVQIGPPRKAAVEISAQVQDSPALIQLSWPNDGDASQYWVSRRTLDSGWQQLATLGGGETSFSDGNVSAGTKYEYQIVKACGAYNGYGYISAGIRVPLVDYRGKVIVLVESSLAGAIDGELNRLQNDLTGDGWVVIRGTAGAYDSPQSVKEKIKGFYASDPANVKALFLIGHIPVPYSGDMYPDGHPNHKGAWPADSYYADMDGNWTDGSVNDTAAERQENRNTPGDGKFDQSNIPSTVELMVGRVDLSNLTCYANKANSRSELDLTRAYLNKDHAFRVGDLTANRRGLICDNFSDKGEDAIVNSAWRSFPGFFGQNSVDQVGWDGFLPAATQNSYLWSFGSGGGSYYYCTGVATSDDLALNNINAIFTMWMGSYFGDWNNESNFLRASLGSGSVLTATYSGFPHTLYFPMALGETVGYAIALTQNNTPNSLYPPWNQGFGQVHIALLGDPTLRMFAVKPPGSLNASTGNDGVHLSWSPSADNVIGYHVYRAASGEGPYTRVTQNAVGSTSFVDGAPAGTYAYMVRAVKLEQTGSGTFYNLSQGTFANGASNGGSQPPPPPQPPSAPVLQATVASFNAVNIQWNDVANETSYKLDRKSASADWTMIATLPANSTSYSDVGLLASTEYQYRIRALNDAGPSDYSAEARVTTASAPQPQANVSFVQVDSGTSGNWPGHFGTIGFALPTKANALAGFSAPTSTWVWSDNTTDARAPFTKPGVTTRLAATWDGDQLTFNITAAQPEQIAFYFLDWDQSGRVETLTLADSVTGVVLDSRDISNFSNGAYAVYAISGAVNVTLTKKAGPNAVLSGVFADPVQSNPISYNPPHLALNRSSNGLVLHVAGDAGQTFKVLTSTNLTNWTELSSGTVQSGGTDVPLSPDRNRAHVYFRTITAP